jgi:hypothetical protein
MESQSCYTKCLRVLNILSEFVARTTRPNEAQLVSGMNTMIGVAEAKYLLKIAKKLMEFMKEYKVNYVHLQTRCSFHVSYFRNLQSLKLKKSFLGEEMLMKVLRSIKRHEIRIKHLDLSKNIVSSLICKEISLICQQMKCLREIMLDSTKISVSGIAYIFMIFIDEESEDQGIGTRQMNDNNNTTMLNDSLLDNSISHLNVDAIQDGRNTNMNHA